MVIKLDKFIEKELKILVSKNQFQKILNSYDFKKPIFQTNTYYDTENRYIKSQNGAMRIRTIGNTNIFTLKIRKDELTHYEYEKEIDTNHLNQIQDPEILSWIKQFNIPLDVKNIVSFSTERYTYDFPNGQLCADITSYESHKDYELEYEYTEDHDGIAVFNQILKPIDLEYQKNCSSKIARAFNN